MYIDFVSPYAPYDEVQDDAAQAAMELLLQVGMPTTTSIRLPGVPADSLIPSHPHQIMTPYRLAHYLKYWFRPVSLPRFTVFDNVDPKIDQLLVVDPIPFWACCSHHMLPFFGTVHFGYIPKDKLIGLSMVPLLVKEFCARPSVQEHLTHELANIFWEKAEPLALGIIVRAVHTCQMLDLGGPPVPQMTLSDLRGAFFESPKARSEFLQLAERRS